MLLDAVHGIEDEDVFSAAINFVREHPMLNALIILDIGRERWLLQARCNDPGRAALALDHFRVCSTLTFPLIHLHGSSRVRSSYLCLSCGSQFSYIER